MPLIAGVSRRHIKHLLTCHPMTLSEGRKLHVHQAYICSFKSDSKHFKN